MFTLSSVRCLPKCLSLSLFSAGMYTLRSWHEPACLTVSRTKAWENYIVVFSLLATCLVVHRGGPLSGLTLEMPDAERNSSLSSGEFIIKSLSTQAKFSRELRHLPSHSRRPLWGYSGFLFLSLCFALRLLSMEKTFFYGTYLCCWLREFGSIDRSFLLMFSVFRWQTAVRSDCCLKFQDPGH